MPKTVGTIKRQDRREWTRYRTCSECGIVQSVRKDNSSTRCQSCSGRAAGAKGLATIRARAKPKATAISRPSRRVDRICETCGEHFSLAQSVVNGSSNASGRFCSRPCYHSFLAATPRVRGRGTSWASTARRVKAATPYCGYCGSTQRLQVHHIIPYRITRDNSQSNLMPLCVKHHRQIETMTCEIERAWPDLSGFAVLADMLRDRQRAARIVLGKAIARRLAA